VASVVADREFIQADHPGPAWLVADLAELDLADLGEAAPFDAVIAGNVMPFVAPDSEARALQRIASHVHADGFVVVGVGLDCGDAREAEAGGYRG